jgi:hypothetical protein
VLLILQFHIQAKYKDKIIFLDTLTKMHTLKTLAKMYTGGKCPYSRSQLLQMKELFNRIKF